MFPLTDAQRELRERARRFATEVVAPHVEEMDRTNEYPWPIVKALAQERFMGMTVPPAYGGDGRSLLDVVLVRALSRPALLAKLRKIYSGSHLDDPAVRWQRGRVIEADAEPGRVPLELDGEPLGTLPACIEVLPAALRVVAPPV